MDRPGEGSIGVRCRQGGDILPPSGRASDQTQGVAMFRLTVLRSAVALSIGLAASTQARAIVFPGDVAPEFHKTDPNGIPHTLSQYRGKVVFLFLLGHN
jgi:cytochrome oxidase Cu insertion factor (SCO1/SenC/PrrC family)